MATAAQVLLPLASQPIPADASERLALAAKAYAELKRAETEVARIEGILGQGEFSARRQGRASQFLAWARKVDAEKLLTACLEVGA